MMEQNDRFSADNVAGTGFSPANRGRPPTPSTSNTAVEIASEMDSLTAQVRDDIAVASGSAQRRGKPTHQNFGRRSRGGAITKSVGRMAVVAVPLGYRSGSIRTVNGSVPTATDVGPNPVTRLDGTSIVRRFAVIGRQPECRAVESPAYWGEPQIHRWKKLT
jgi:hypothetical protein